jgi:hypothetical protein
MNGLIKEAPSLLAVMLAICFVNGVVYATVLLDGHVGLLTFGDIVNASLIVSPLVVSWTLLVMIVFLALVSSEKKQDNLSTVNWWVNLILTLVFLCLLYAPIKASHKPSGYQMLNSGKS